MNVKSLLEDRELIVLAEPTEEASSVRSRAEERLVSLHENRTNISRHLHDSSIDEIRDVESIFADWRIIQRRKDHFGQLLDAVSTLRKLIMFYFDWTLGVPI